MKKKVLAVPFGAAAALALLGAVAYSCTNFMGTFSVTGNAPDAGTVVSTGLDDGSNFTMTQVVQGHTAANAAKGKVTVETGASVLSKLPASSSTHPKTGAPVGPYDINFWDGLAYVAHTQWISDCMSFPRRTANPPAEFHTIGQVTVGDDGRLAGGKEQFALPKNAETVVSNPGESAVCISEPLGWYGNQVPITML